MNNTKRLLLIVTAVALAAALCPAAQSPEGERKPEDIRLVLDLSGGSRLIGTPSGTSVEVVASYGPQGALTIPWSSVERLTANDDKETFSLRLRDGQQLKVILKAKEIPLTTGLGKLSVPAETLRAVGILGAGLPAAFREGLILHYAFDKDEGGKVTDLSGKGHDGTVRGAEWKHDGIAGGAMSFDANKYVDTGCNLSGMDEITVSGWVRPSRDARGASVVTQFGSGSQNDVWALFAQADSSEDLIPPHKCIATLVTGEEGARELNGEWEVDRGGEFRRFRSRRVMERRLGLWGKPTGLGKWTHLCFTFKRHGQFALYQNGMRVAQTEAGNAPLRKRDSTTKVGASLGGDGYWGFGLIDEVMIWNRALTGEEVAALYRENAPASSRADLEGSSAGPSADVPKGEGEKDALQFVLAVDGGSRLVGTPSAASADVVTSFGTLTIPWRDVARATANDDKETFSVRLRDGQRFKAVLKAKEIGLTTGLGKLSVPVQKLLAIEIRGGGMLAAVKDSLMLHYAFDQEEGDKVTDLSGKGNDGYWVGSPMYEAGVKGKAARFRSRETYIVSPSPKLNMNGWKGMTVSLWVSVAGHTLYGHVINRGPISTDKPAAFELAIGHGYGKGVFVVQNTPTNGCPTVVAGPGNLPVNRWCHLAGTYDGEMMRYYINGKLEKETRISDSPAPICEDPDTKLVIGNMSRIPFINWFDMFFNGWVDEVYIFNRALTADEIRDLGDLQDGSRESDSSAASPSGLRKEPVLCYSFDKDEGGKVTDLSGNGNNGVVNGAAWTSKGKVGGAYRFSGGKDHILLDSPALRKSSADSFSVAVWFYAEELNPKDENTVFGISAPRGVNDGAFSYRIGLGRPNNQGTDFALGFTAGTWCRDNSTSPFLLGLKEKQWYHAVGVYDKGDIRLYVNGEANGVEKYSLGSTPASTALNGCIGNCVDQLESRGFKGTVDELEFFDRALSAGEVRGLYALQAGGQKLDDGSARMIVRLAKGSELVATVPDKAIALTTSLGKLDLPFAQVRTMGLDNGPGAVKVVLVTGDIFLGALQAKQFTLKTLLGELTIPVAQIRNMESLGLAPVTKGR